MTVGRSEDDRFAECVAFTLHAEDQTDTGVFTDDPRDSGGATRWGVTQKTLSEWFGRPATKDEVRTLPRSVACDIARHKYWVPMKCGQLAPGVDLMMFDFGYNAGNDRAVRVLQKVVGAVQDGVIGPKTLAAAADYDPAHLAALLADAQETFYRSLPKFSVYGNGWLDRTEKRRASALRLAQAAAA